MKWLNTLTEKPWQEPGQKEAVLHVGSRSENYSKLLIHQQKFIALMFFLAVISVLFSLFLLTFLARSQYPDFQALAGDVWQPFYHPGRLWMNTAILCLASISLQVAYRRSVEEHFTAVRLALWSSICLTVAFIVAQWMLWRYLYDLGFYLTANPGNSYFYLLTAVHAVHLAGGVGVLTLVAVDYSREGELSRLHRSLRLCAIYWHYLLVVWGLLFFFSVSSPETYKLLAALCGY